ncbi:MAG: hypothetical protein GWO24_19360, partial [Akkermansiaceae bacterium]|nr:hypothetical protein [Akkermansiaceae bacterium]
SELGDISDPAGWDFDNFDEETVSEVMGKMSDFHQRVQVRAGTILDEQQIQVLSASQEQQRSVQSMGMRMGLEFMKSAAGRE